MTIDLKSAIARLAVHAWGTTSMSSDRVLSDVLLRVEFGETVDLASIRKVLLEDLQALNIAFHNLNANRILPDVISFELTYSLSKIMTLLLDLSAKSDSQSSNELVVIARDVAAAWYCVLSQDIENVEDGF